MTGIFNDVTKVMIGNDEITSMKIGTTVIYEKEEEESILTAIVQEYDSRKVRLGTTRYSDPPWIIFKEGVTPEIDWGDGTIETINPLQQLEHTYTTEETTHEITIRDVVGFNHGVFAGELYEGYYQCDLRAISIPNSVVKLGYEFIRYCYNLTSISLPSSITTMQDECLKGNGFVSLVVPPLVTIIPQGMVYGCPNLETVILHEGITEINKWAFANCSKLENLNIPLSVVTIKKGAFDNVKGDIILNWDSANNIVQFSSEWGIGCNISIPHDTTQLYIDAGYPSAKLVERSE